MSVTLHDLQDLRRKVLMDKRAVEDGALEGHDILEGVVSHLELLIEKQRIPTGAMGLPFVQIGEVVQSLAAVIVDREVYSKDIVRDALLHNGFDEGLFWEEVGGAAVDRLTEMIELDPQGDSA